MPLKHFGMLFLIAWSKSHHYSLNIILGRNSSYRNEFDGLENWHRNYDLRLSGLQNLSVDDDQLRKMGHYHSHKNAQLDPGLGQCMKNCNYRIDFWVTNISLRSFCGRPAT